MSLAEDDSGMLASPPHLATEREPPLIFIYPKAPPDSGELQLLSSANGLVKKAFELHVTVSFGNGPQFSNDLRS